MNLSLLPIALVHLPGRRSALVRYGGALAIVVAAALVRAMLAPYLGAGGFAISLLGMLLAAWVGELEASLIAQQAVLVMERLWFPQDHVPSDQDRGYAGMVAFYAVGATVALLSEAVRAAQARAAAQQQRAAAQREQLQATLAGMADAVIVVDAQRKIALLNEAAETLLGQSRAECLGREVGEVLSLSHETANNNDEGVELAADLPVATVLNHSADQRNVPARLTAAGQTTPVSYSATPLRNESGAVAGVVLVIRDETERRVAEDAVREADRRKDQFLATLAHELRNPLAPIRLGLDLLNDLADDPQGAQEVRDTMLRQTDHIIRLVDDLLDVSRVTRGKLELRRQPVLLADVVQQAIEATWHLVDEGRLEFTAVLPPLPITLAADPNRLAQIICNLLNNAAKYTPPGGRVELRCQAADGGVEITVADTGAGIPPDKLDDIFGIFTQLKSSSRERGQSGLGIGLTLVKQLVEMHGGRIDAASRGLGLGSRFTVWLPAVSAATVAGAAEPPAPAIDTSGAARSLPSTSPPPPVKRRVLVVDDNADARTVLSLLVGKMGHEVHTAADGVEAIELFGRLHPDAILMDLGMPRMDGLEAGQEIRRRANGHSPLLVATTGWGQEADRARTSRAGFDHHLVKPIDAAVLRQLLEEGRPQPANGAPPSVKPSEPTGSTLA